MQGLRYWPSQPFWDQLANGSDLQKRAVNFESHWCGEKLVGYETLEVDKNFDDIVIAISVGEFKRLNDDNSIAQAVLDTDPEFREMTQRINLIPTQSFNSGAIRAFTISGGKSHHLRPSDGDPLITSGLI